LNLDRDNVGHDKSRKQLALRHVLTGRKIIASQRERIERRRAKGLDATEAERLLAQYERTQEIFESDLKRIQNEEKAASVGGSFLEGPRSKSKSDS